MSRIVFGSPGAQRVLERDRELRRKEARKVARLEDNRERLKEISGEIRRVENKLADLEEERLRLQQDIEEAEELLEAGYKLVETVNPRVQRVLFEEALHVQP